MLTGSTSETLPQPVVVAVTIRTAHDVFVDAHCLKYGAHVDVQCGSASHHSSCAKFHRVSTTNMIGDVDWAGEIVFLTIPSSAADSSLTFRIISASSGATSAAPGVKHTLATGKRGIDIGSIMPPRSGGSGTGSGTGKYKRVCIPLDTTGPDGADPELFVGVRCMMLPSPPAASTHRATTAVSAATRPDSVRVDAPLASPPPPPPPPHHTRRNKEEEEEEEEEGQTQQQQQQQQQVAEAHDLTDSGETKAATVSTMSVPSAAVASVVTPHLASNASGPPRPFLRQLKQMKQQQPQQAGTPSGAATCGMSVTSMAVGVTVTPLLTPTPSSSAAPATSHTPVTVTPVHVATATPSSPTVRSAQSSKLSVPTTPHSAGSGTRMYFPTGGDDGCSDSGSDSFAFVKPDKPVGAAPVPAAAAPLSHKDVEEVFYSYADDRSGLISFAQLKRGIHVRLVRACLTDRRTRRFLSRAGCVDVARHCACLCFDFASIPVHDPMSVRMFIRVAYFVPHIIGPVDFITKLGKPINLRHPPLRSPPYTTTAVTLAFGGTNAQGDHAGAGGAGAGAGMTGAGSGHSLVGTARSSPAAPTITTTTTTASPALSPAPSPSPTPAAGAGGGQGSGDTDMEFAIPRGVGLVVDSDGVESVASTDGSDQGVGSVGAASVASASTAGMGGVHDSDQETSATTLARMVLHFVRGATPADRANRLFDSFLTASHNHRRGRRGGGGGGGSGSGSPRFRSRASAPRMHRRTGDSPRRRVRRSGSGRHSPRTDPAVLTVQELIDCLVDVFARVLYVAAASDTGHKDGSGRRRGAASAATAAGAGAGTGMSWSPMGLTSFVEYSKASRSAVEAVVADTVSVPSSSLIDRPCFVAWALQHLTDSDVRPSTAYTLPTRET